MQIKNKFQEWFKLDNMSFKLKIKMKAKVYTYQYAFQEMEV